MPRDLIDTMKEIAGSSTYRARVGIIRQLTPTTALVERVGSTRYLTCTWDANVSVAVGKQCVVDWIPGRQFVITSVYNNPHTLPPNDQRDGLELFPPEALVATGVIGGVLLTWEVPVAKRFTFAVQYNTSASDAGAVELGRMAGGEFTHLTAVGGYYRVGSYTDIWRFSGWSTWVNATPSALTSGDVAAAVGALLAAGAHISITGTNPLTIAVTGIGSAIQAWSNELDALAALADTGGLIRKTADHTYVFDTSTYLTGNQNITVTGDASGSGTTAITLTLATVPVVKGGTGAVNASDARDNLGLTIGANVLAYSSELAYIVGHLATGFLKRTGANAWSFVTLAASDISDFSTAADARIAAAVGSVVQAFSALLTQIAAISSNGFISRTGSGTAASRTLTGTANRVTITNPTGSAGDPVFDVGSLVVVKDANSNIAVNAVDEGWNDFVASAVTVTLAANSPPQQRVSGTLAQTIKLAPANTLALGHRFWLRNASTGDLTIQDNAGGALHTLKTGQEIRYFCRDISTASGLWSSEGAATTQPFTNKTVDAALNEVYVKTSSANVSNPPTVAEMNGAYGSTPVGHAGILINDNGAWANVYLGFYDPTRATWIVFNGAAETLDAPTWSIPTSDGIYLSAAPDLTWVALPTGATYDLQVSVNSDMSSPFVDLNGGTALSVLHYLTSGLSLHTTYYSRVRQHTTLGTSPWSATRSFLYTDPLLTYISGLASLTAYWPGTGTSYLNVINPALTEGRNLVLDPTPTGSTGWTLNTGWAYAANKFTHTPGNVGAASAVTSLSNVIGRIYKVVFTISGSTTGTVTAALTATGAAQTGNGVKTDYILATGSGLSFTPSSGFDGSISTFSVTAVGHPASSAFPTTELVKDAGFDYPSSAWAAAVNWAQASSKATHTTGSVATLNQAISIIIGRTYDVIVVVSGRTAGSITPRAGSTGTGASAITANGTAATQVLTCAGNSVFTLVPTTDFDGAIESVSVVPHDGLIAQDGVLELWTNATTLTYWTKALAGTSTVNQETSVVHGGSNACRIDLDGSGSLAHISQNSLKAGSTYLVTFWAKCSSGSPLIAVANTAGAVYTNGSFTLTATYVQYSVVIVAIDASIDFRRNSATASVSLYIDDIVVTEIPPMSMKLVNGLAVGHTPSQPLLITEVSSDGVDDVAVQPGTMFNDYFSPSKFTWGANAENLSWTDGLQRFIRRYTVNANNGINIAKSATNNTVTFTYIAGGVTKTITVTFSGTGNHHYAMSVDATVPGDPIHDLMIAYIDGVSVGTATGLGTWSANITATGVLLGGASSVGASSWNGYWSNQFDCSDVLSAAVIKGVAQLSGAAL